jgi:hypothetical protein
MARQTLIHCDHPDCEATVWVGEQSAAGWTRDGARDYCPKHSPR